MKHEKTFDAIEKLKEVELELHRLKNALELANKMLDAQRTWVGLTDKDTDVSHLAYSGMSTDYIDGYEAGMEAAEDKLKEKNT